MMNTLVYKRTHRGDPCEEGIFGCNNCMRSVRCRSFDAVIGVGGKSQWPREQGIARKLNWIGRNARKSGLAEDGFPTIVFDWFVLWNEEGPDFKGLAPRLYEYMFKKGHDVRHVMSSSNCLSRKMRKEIEDILSFFEHPEHFPSPKVILQDGKHMPVSQRPTKPTQKDIDSCRRNRISAQHPEDKRVCRSSC